MTGNFEKPLQRNIFIIGGNSRLAKALVNYYDNGSFFLLKRGIYESWYDKSKRSIIRDYFKSQITSDSIVFITSGILNSKEKSQTINDVNYKLPWNIIKALEGLEVTIVTFGTILENIKDSSNNYVKSKIKLSEKILTFKSSKAKVIHFRLHTLYGYGYPSEFMFLGQLYNSIKNKREFYMSSGYQIREYHHLDDVAQSIDVVIRNDVDGVIELTSGNGIMLRDLAKGIFNEFDLTDLLKIGSLDIQHKEKFSNDYTKNEILTGVAFRDPVDGVCDYLKTII